MTGSATQYMKKHLLGLVGIVMRGWWYEFQQGDNFNTHAYYIEIQYIYLLLLVLQL